MTNESWGHKVYVLKNHWGLVKMISFTMNTMGSQATVKILANGTVDKESMISVSALTW